MTTTEDEENPRTPIRFGCKRMASGRHPLVETSRNIYDFIGSEVFVYYHCTECGYKVIDVEPLNG
jgi:C4-type Zn-finger protein